jgi:flavodoxin
MKSLIIYDSIYGSTAMVALAIKRALDERGDVAISLVRTVQPDMIEDVDLLIVGSPTQGGQPTRAMLEYVRDLPDARVRRLRVATFDTRYAEANHGFGLKILMRIVGYAAPKMADILRTKGGTLVGNPEGFIVVGKEGPLKDDELNRAITWARTLIKR